MARRPVFPTVVVLNPVYYSTTNVQYLMPLCVVVVHPSVDGYRTDNFKLGTQENGSRYRNTRGHALVI